MPPNYWVSVQGRIYSRWWTLSLRRNRGQQSRWADFDLREGAEANAPQLLSFKGGSIADDGAKTGPSATLGFFHSVPLEYMWSPVGPYIHPMLYQSEYVHVYTFLRSMDIIKQKRKTTPFKNLLTIWSNVFVYGNFWRFETIWKGVAVYKFSWQVQMLTNVCWSVLWSHLQLTKVFGL